MSLKSSRFAWRSFTFVPLFESFHFPVSLSSVMGTLCIDKNLQNLLIVSMFCSAAVDYTQFRYYFLAIIPLFFGNGSNDWSQVTVWIANAKCFVNSVKIEKWFKNHIFFVCFRHFRGLSFRDFHWKQAFVGYSKRCGFLQRHLFTLLFFALQLFFLPFLWSLLLSLASYLLWQSKSTQFVNLYRKGLEWGANLTPHSST